VAADPAHRRRRAAGRPARLGSAVLPAAGPGRRAGRGLRRGHGRRGGPGARGGGRRCWTCPGCAT
jgi:hypothetical protein